MSQAQKRNHKNGRATPAPMPAEVAPVAPVAPVASATPAAPQEADVPVLAVLPDEPQKLLEGGAKPKKYPVGAKIVASDEDFKLIKAGQDRVQSLKMASGDLRYKYLTQEAQILQAVVKAEQEVASVVGMVGRKHGLNIGSESDERWAYDPDARTFTRLG